MSSKSFHSSSQHWKYPYEILYENKGVCSDKSRLLACLLKELGFGCVLFVYNSENHEAVGIKCPIPDEVVHVYDGIAFNSILEEYNDAQT